MQFLVLSVSRPQPRVIPEIDIWRAATLLLKRYGEKALYEGGLRITTTLDLSTQAMADKWVKAGVKAFAKRSVNTGAMLVMNPADGEARKATTSATSAPS